MDPEVVAALADGTRLVIWLDAPADVLADRTAGQDHRPLLGDDPGSVLARQRAERAERYAALADLTLDATRSPPTWPPRSPAALDRHLVEGRSST